MNLLKFHVLMLENIHENVMIFHANFMNLLSSSDTQVSTYTQTHTYTRTQVHTPTDTQDIITSYNNHTVMTRTPSSPCTHYTHNMYTLHT